MVRKTKQSAAAAALFAEVRALVRAEEQRSARRAKRLRVSLRAIADQYLLDMETRCRPRNIEFCRGYLGRILRELGVAYVDELTKTRVVAWRQMRIAQGVSNATVNTELIPFTAALNFAVRLEQIATNPLNGLRALPMTTKHRRRSARALSEPEIARLLESARALDLRLGRAQRVGKHPRVLQRPLLVFLVGTGARWTETISLCWRDVQLGDREGAITFRGETTKTETTRTIPLQTWVLDDILEHRRQESRRLGRDPAADERVFLSAAGKPHNSGKRPSSWRMSFLGRALDEAGIQRIDADGRRVHVHALRHTFATRLARHGVSVGTAQKLTGHRTPSMLLNVYTHVTAEDARVAVNTLPNPTSGAAHLGALR